MTMRLYSLFALVLFPMVLPAQEVAEGKPAEDLKQVAIGSVKDYSVRAAANPDQSFKLLAEPVVRFNTSGIDEGDVMIWTRDGRPEVAAQVFHLNTGTGHIWLHEFQSLSSEPLVLERASRVLWKPEEPGMNWAPIPSDVAAAKSAPARLTQIKQFARRFTGQEQSPGVSGSQELKNFELRMKPREIYRYDAPARGILDGVVFYFAQEDLSDPELLLLIEAHETAGKPGWRFACAPLSCWAMQVQLDGTEVVRIPSRYLKSEIGEPYHIWRWQADE